MEPLEIVIVHEFPVIVDLEFKHAEESLPSSSDEAPGSKVLLHHTSKVPTVLESIDPSYKDQTPSTLYVASVFQWTLFGFGFGLFHASTIESIIVMADPPPTGLVAPGSSNLTHVEIFGTTPLFGDDSHPKLTFDVS